MALASDSITVTPGSGSTVATHSPGGSNTTEHQVMAPANSSGFIGETMPTYGLSIPQLGCAVNAYHWELFNHPSSGKTLTLRGLWPVPELSVANTVLNPERYALYRTTVVASGGTASAAFESATTTLANFFRLNPGDTSLSSHISARTKLTSITTGSFLWQIYVSSLCSMRNGDCQEATNWNQFLQATNCIPQREFGEELSIPAGQGIALREGSVVGAGQLGWLMEFTVDP